MSIQNAKTAEVPEASPSTLDPSSTKPQLSSPLDPFPPLLLERPDVQLDAGSSFSPWQQVKHALVRAETSSAAVDDVADLVRLSGPRQLLGAALDAHLDALGGLGEHRFETSLSMLDAVEALPVFDGEFATHLWRCVRGTLPLDARESDERVVLFDRLRRHQQIADAWQLAAPSPAMAEGPTHAGLTVEAIRAREEEMKRRTAAARENFDPRSPSSWDGVAMTVTVEGHGATIRTQLDRGPVPVGATIRLRRLDVLACPRSCELVVAGHAMHIDAGDEVTAWGMLSTHLDVAAFDALRASMK